MLHLLFLLFLGIVSGHRNRNTWDRIVLSGKDIINSTSSGSRVIDPEGNRTKAFLGYCDLDIQEQRATANFRFMENFGIDTSSLVYNPTLGYWPIPGLGIMINYANGDDLLYRVHYDSWNNQVEKKGEHIYYQWGFLIQLTGGPGNFTGGKMAGKPYYKNDILGATRVELLDLSKRQHWSNPNKCNWKCRDINDNYSEVPSNQYPGPDGLNYNIDIARPTNRRTGLVGHLASHVSAKRLDDGVTTIQRTRNMITFGPMERHLPY